MTEFASGQLLRDVCTLGIGGAADHYVTVSTIDEMQQAIVICKSEGLDFFILGKGSNCLFDDRGFRGVVIHNKISFFEEQTPHTFHVGAGYSFSLLGSQTARKGLTGLEFASGIPGTVGGAVFMNAGANGRETCESLLSVEFVDSEGAFSTILKDDLMFSYRHSSFHSMSGAIVGATFSLNPLLEARERQLEIITYRKQTQPYGDKSAGCVFRNPSSGHAGAMIEQAGLKGLSVGGAQVSPMHGNFIVNTGGATADDITHLIELVREKIETQYGIKLESEIQIIPSEQPVPR